MNSLIFFNLVLASVMGQDITAADVAAVDTTNVSPVPINDYFSQGEAVGLVQPTSPIEPANAAAAKETSLEYGAKETSAEAAAPTAPIVMNGHEGDTKGARVRQNLFHFGAADRHPHYDCNTEYNHHHYHEVNPQNRPYGDSNPFPNRGHGPVVPNREVPPPLPPYLRVTPSVVRQPYTRTHVETSTSTEYDVSTETITRTVTEELYSTQTHVFHPVHTFTLVDYRTQLEYPGSTIDPARVRTVPTAAPEWPPAWGGSNCVY